MDVKLFRIERGDQGTHGLLYYENFMCHTLELPWRDNQRNISSIPPGEYPAVIRSSPRFGRVYWIQEVPDRTFILIHSGNWAGDTKLGYKSHVNGCIILGQRFGTLSGQWAVLNSRVTVRRFMDKMADRPFTLKIFQNFGGE